MQTETVKPYRSRAERLERLKARQAKLEKEKLNYCDLLSDIRKIEKLIDEIEAEVKIEARRLEVDPGQIPPATPFAPGWVN
jgi:hypothetical protein